MDRVAMHMTSVSHRVNRAVLDRTGLTGTFDVELDFFRPLDEAVAHFPPLTAALAARRSYPSTPEPTKTVTESSKVSSLPRGI